MNQQNHAPASPRTTAGLYLISAFAAYLYVLIEWAFTVTKPSYINNWSWLKKIELFFFSGGLLCGLLFLGLAALALIAQLPGLKSQAERTTRAARVVPALVLALLALMLLDNFTYTIVKFGIVSTRGIGRGVYALVFLALVVQFFRVSGRDLNRLEARLAGLSCRRWILPGLAAFVLACITAPLLIHERGAGSRDLTAGYVFSSRPNILYITSDGVDAARMSLYGYERDTTPFLNEMAKTSLVAENAFPNAAKTSGSIISALTGREPGDTRVLVQPNILQGQDAYLHLPGIFRSAGYRTAQFSFPYYVDAYALNVLNGFDSANGRSFKRDSLISRLINYAPTDFAYFLLDSTSRPLDRLKHIFFIQPMSNPYLLVTDPDAILDGEQQVDDLLRLLDQPGPPVFAHLHLLGTHGPWFQVKRPVFSQGKDPQAVDRYDDDLYDDSLLEFDGSVERIVNQLRADGMLENTVLIIGSDHGLKYSPDKRIPLLIRFPHGAHAGRVSANVQNLDIAPTLLDYLGVELPEWMQGRSLLDPVDPGRPVFVMDVANPDETDLAFWYNRPVQWEPPFFQFGSLTAIYCDGWYTLNLTNEALTRGEVTGSTAACPGRQPSDLQVYAGMVEHLKANGFDTTDLEAVQAAQFKPLPPAQ